MQLSEIPMLMISGKLLNHGASNVKIKKDCNEREMEQIAYGDLPRFDPHKHCDDDCIGLNGETSWILVTDQFSRMKHGDTRVSKASPVNWLRDFL